MLVFEKKRIRNGKKRKIQAIKIEKKEKKIIIKINIIKKNKEK